MAESDYIAALKLGRKCYQEALTKGEYPYLPVLDEILSYTDIVSTVSLGTMDIPLDKLVGTKTAERSTSFANNFMPLLPERSEFGAKWASLYDHQIEDGITDPIVAYEFMNQFYVQEGNKRVSVMKYLDAYSISGNVTRLIPRRTDEKDNRLYYEFLDFYKVSLNCDVWFSKEGSYKKLEKLLGYEPGKVWDQEERLFFRSSYGRFAKAYRMAHGERLELTASDAFLVYLEIYGYDLVKGQTEREMYQALMKIWKEIQLADGGNKIDLIQNPEEVEVPDRHSLLRWFRPSDSQELQNLKAAFIYAKTAETSSWSYSHELGRLYLEEAFEGKVKTCVFDQADSEEKTAQAIEDAAAAGCTIIFTTSPQMANQSVRSAILHPEVKIYNCSVNMSYSSICTYYARMYESKFLMGALAAALSREDKLGYIADYPIYGSIANINAFALGARMINPYVRVFLEWSRTTSPVSPEEQFQEQGITYISGSDMITPEHASREYGLYIKKEGQKVENLATSIYHWGKFYERILQIEEKGSSEIKARMGKKAVNYWWGMSADVIDVICSENLPHGTGRLIEFLKNSIRMGSFEPFEGLIYDQKGNLICEEGRSIKPEEIVRMDWLAENVVGSVPAFEELTKEAQELVQLQGVVIDENGDEEREQQ